MVRRQIAFYILAILFLLIVTFHAHASTDSIVFDFTDDFQSYARKVSELNHEKQVLQTQSSDNGRKRSSIQLVALLCKTDGREIDFESLSPSYIIAGPRNCFTLFFSSKDLCLSAVSSLVETDGIIYAESDCEVHANSTQGEESTPSSHSFHSWGASQMNIGEYIDYTESWGSGSANIAVIDSGVFPHSLIQGKLLSSGYDYVDADEDSTNDPFGHGTNVAGVIADCTSGEPVYIYPIRVLNSSGSGKMSNVINGVREAKSKGVTVINLSLESSVMSEALDDAILEAVSSGIIVVVAAGNSSCNTSNVCPAHLTNSGVVVVGSAEGSGGSYTIASYSNYGSSVDVYAFGSGISCCSNSGGYSTETGTSIAAPHISALCALIHIVHPELSPSQLEKRLQAASIGSGSVIVPDSQLMIPLNQGFFLSKVRMNVNDVLPLPSTAYPDTSCESITYHSSDNQVAIINDSSLIATGVGTGTITATCKGFNDISFMLIVSDYPNGTIELSNVLEYIDDEAFSGLERVGSIFIPESVYGIGNNAFDECCSLKWIRIPDSVIEIGKNMFSDAVIVCSWQSMIYNFAIEHGLQYVVISQ